MWNRRTDRDTTSGTRTSRSVHKGDRCSPFLARGRGDRKGGVSRAWGRAGVLVGPLDPEGAIAWVWANRLARLFVDGERGPQGAGGRGCCEARCGRARCHRSFLGARIPLLLPEGEGGRRPDEGPWPSRRRRSLIRRCATPSPSGEKGWYGPKIPWSHSIPKDPHADCITMR